MGTLFVKDLVRTQKINVILKESGRREQMLEGDHFNHSRVGCLSFLIN